MATHFHITASREDQRPALELLDGAWVYAGTEIEAVGAQPITLGEAIEPRQVSRPGHEPESVVLSLSEIRAHKGLSWAISRDYSVELVGGEEPLYLIPWPVWQEHAAEIVGAMLPEFDQPGIEAAMAAVERHHRFAKAKLDELGRARTQLMILGSRAGRTRRQLGEAVGLSAARVHQLIDAADAGAIEDLDEFLEGADEVFALLRTQPRQRDGLALALGADRSDELVDQLLATRLIEESETGFRISADGEAVNASSPIASSRPKAAR